jgi:NTE family protein
LGAATIYVLPASYPCQLDAPPPSALGIALHAINLMVHARLTADVAKFQVDHRLLVVPPMCPIAVSPVDFSHGAELIDQARESTTNWLATRDPDADQAAVLNPS